MSELPLGKLPALVLDGFAVAIPQKIKRISWQKNAMGANRVLRFKVAVRGRSL